MPYGLVKGIFISPQAGEPMQELESVQAIAGGGLEGDRYATGEGSFNRKLGTGNRQVTMMNSIFFEGSGYTFGESRRNLFVSGVELMWLIGREFQIGNATFRGVKYCDPCRRPDKLAGDMSRHFQNTFFDRGGLIADVITSGLIRRGCDVIPPKKGY